MNQKIQVLNEHLANMIAAGEVVERPASVVKELVENSIDASSKTIKIDLVDCGLKCIKVSDDGTGIEKDEIPLALLRHATSKISSELDLFNVLSLGFRGEALPSIASVSKLRISSCTDDIHGYSYLFDTGKVIEESSCAMQRGTQVEVSNLFFNTPARLKHLKNNYSELSLIIDYLTKAALSHPSIKFTLTNNTKVLFKTLGNNNVPSIMNEAFGKTTEEQLFAFSGQTDLYKFNGYASDTTLFRSNKNAITIILNGRVIKNSSLIYAICNAYNTLLPIGKFPVATIYIECDPTLVDVNVHPSKLEVRILDSKKVEEEITKTIYSALINRLNERYTITNEENFETKNESLKTVFKENETFKEYNNSTEEILEDPWQMFNAFEDKQKDVEIVEDEDDLEEEFENEEEIEQLTIADIPSNTNKNSFKNLQYIGSFYETYLILTNENTLYLIDQHAAMERVMYEKIKTAFSAPHNSTYELLIPITLEYSLSEINDILDSSISAELKKLSILAESFGDTTIIIREIPSWIPAGLEIEFTRDIIDHLLNNKLVNKQIMYESLAKSLACKKSIKANMHIRLDEVKKLLSDLDECEMPYTCPHGRPTIVKLTNYDLEKMFKRVI